MVQIQARLYWRLIRSTLDKDDYFREFTLADYTFIVVNSNTLTPLVWVFEQTQTHGSIKFGSSQSIVLRDPYAIGEELSYYLSDSKKLPIGITLNSPNSLQEWLNNYADNLVH